MARLLALTVTGKRMIRPADLDHVDGVGWEAGGPTRLAGRIVVVVVLVAVAMYYLRWAYGGKKKGQIIAHKTRWLAGQSG